MKTTIKKLSLLIVLIFSLLYFLTPLIIDWGFTDKYNPPKEFYFTLVAFLSLIYWQTNSLLSKAKEKFTVNVVDILFLSFILLYLSPFIIDKENYVALNLKPLIYISLAIFYFFIKANMSEFRLLESENKKVTPFTIGLLVISFCEVIIGVIQLLTSEMVRGTFDNSGPFSNYLSIMFVLFFAILLLGTSKSKIRNSSIVVFLAGTIVLLITTQARTAWISTLIGSIIVLGVKLNFLERLKSKKLSPLNKLMIGLIIALILSSTGWLIYQLKKDSADGRLFIWKTTISAIAEKPVFGHGPDNFQSARNREQATYFEKNWHEEREKYLADTIEYAFNDYLQITAEVGLIGLLLFLTILIVCFKTQNNDLNRVVIKIGLITILITSLTSYSFYKIPTQMLYVFFFAMLSTDNSQWEFSLRVSNVIKSITSIILVFVSILVIIFCLHTISGYHHWKKTYSTLKKENSPITTSVFYNKLYPILQNDPYFLYNYGTVMSNLQLYVESTEALEKCKDKLYDSDVMTFLGNNYVILQRYPEAEKAYLEAIYLAPVKFFPKYQLVKFYEAKGEIEKAFYWAKEILNQEPKVPSKMVSDIKDEMVRFINKYSNPKK